MLSQSNGLNTTDHNNIMAANLDILSYKFLENNVLSIKEELLIKDFVRFLKEEIKK